MTLAWTTLVVIVALLPGVAFLVGLAAPERHAKEVVRTGALGDIGVALFVSIVLHVVVIAIVVGLGFNLRGLVRAVTVFEDTSSNALRVDLVAKWLPRLAGYVVVTAFASFGIGFGFARLVIAGPLRFAARHRWAYDVLKFGSGVTEVVTAYVLSTTVENDRALMYKGRLSEFFLNADGTVAYLVLQNCTRFYMKFEGDLPVTTEHMSIFDGASREAATREWNYLLIQGANIANVLFDKSLAIDASASGQDALRRALDDLRHG